MNVMSRVRPAFLVAPVLTCVGYAGWLATRPPPGAPAPGETVEIRVPPGSGALAIGRQLRDAGLVRFPRLFSLAARLRGVDASLKAGLYEFDGGAGWSDLLDALSRGEVVTFPLTVPEGFTTRELAPRLAAAAGVTADSILGLLQDTAMARSLGVPGPTLEGYLFPDTYRFAEGVPPVVALQTMIDRYLAFWTPERRASLGALGLSEREVVTLASIVEEEARVPTSGGSSRGCT